MKIKNFIKYTNDFIINIFCKIFKKKPNVMSDKQTINYIIENKCGIARYGDGELRLMRGIDLEFQKYDKSLAQKLKNIESNSRCLVCIPSIFSPNNFNSNIITDEEYKYWNKFKRNRGGLWHLYFSNNDVLGDAFVSRFYLRKKDKSTVSNYVQHFKKIWNDRNVLIVEGETTKIGVGNDILNNTNSIRRIVCPNVNAYDYYEKIKKVINENYNNDDLVLIALGPTATILAYDLCNEGMQALDLGHFDIEYEWFLAKTNKKIPVKNKHVSECAEMGTKEENNKTYLSQVRARIGSGNE